MTAHKHLKQLVRARMARTGEAYAAARRQIIATSGQLPPHPAARHHRPGNVPAATALRVLLAQAGAPLGEAMCFGIAGGIGVGVFSFFYEKEDMATFFIAGRHAWHDDLLYLQGALGRLGLTPAIWETGGARAAEAQLREALALHGACVAWVDMAGLPQRAMPQSWGGGGYHVVTVYAIDDVAGTALIGDLADDPVSIPMADLAAARGRIKKQRNRLLALPHAGPPTNLEGAIWAGLRACHAGLVDPPLRQAPANAHLDALLAWAGRMSGGRGRDSWERSFRPGANLWRGLCAIYDFIEHYGTGGGLCRPLFADFLADAGASLGRPDLLALAEQYAALGRAWSDLAAAALPGDVPLLGEARELSARRAELAHSGGDPADIGAVWGQIEGLARRAAEQFPLSASACAELRAGLSGRIAALHAGELAAHAALGAAVG